MGRKLAAALLAALLSLLISAQAVSLESALADQANLTTFRGLVKVRYSEEDLGSRDLVARQTN
jgi:hypothetical protein